MGPLLGLSGILGERGLGWVVHLFLDEMLLKYTLSGCDRGRDHDRDRLPNIFKFKVLLNDPVTDE